MICNYCGFYQESPTRIEDQRFCNHVQKMVHGDWEICEDGFEVHKFFWCKETNQTIDLAVCPARQSRGMQECTKCQQKQDILEIRKFMGRKNGNGFMEKKKIIKKEVPEEPKPKIILHKRIKEEPKKLLKKKGV